MVHPEPGWERIFEQLAGARDLHLCFAPGVFRLSEPITITARRGVRITGSGGSTRILALGHETALLFSGCDDVTVRDLYVETGTVGMSGRLEHRGGTLTFEGCRRVTLEGVQLLCGGGAMTASACLTVRALLQPIERRPVLDGVAVAPGVGQLVRRVELVRVRGCDLSVGFRQSGMVILDAVRAQIEDNTLRAALRPAGLTFAQLVQNQVFRGRVRRLLVRALRVDGPRREDVFGDQVLARLGRRQLEFRTAPSLVQAWQPVLRTFNFPAGGPTPHEAALTLRRVADHVLLQSGPLAGDQGLFQAWYDRMQASRGSAMNQGIVIGGQVAIDVRVRGNSVYGAVQGIHVGTSLHEAQGLAARRVEITDNTVLSSLPAEEVGERHGIFLGNCHSGLIAQNYLTFGRVQLDRAADPVDGIRAHGLYGRFLVIEKNHADGFTTGIRVQATAIFAQRQMQWTVTDNMAQDAQTAVVANAGVTVARNLT